MDFNNLWLAIRFHNCRVALVSVKLSVFISASSGEVYLQCSGKVVVAAVICCAGPMKLPIEHQQLLHALTACSSRLHAGDEKGYPTLSMVP